MPILEVKNLHKSFGREQVLRGIDFSLEQGEVLAIIGSSGSGKTTLLRCLNFLEQADAGEILVNGETIFDAVNRGRYSEAQIRMSRLHFGLVFQQFNLFPQYTVSKNLMLAAELLELPGKGALRHEVSANIRERCDRLLQRVGLAHKSDAYPGELSGGQQQRVAIARALMLRPDVLCFDEPTSALDPELTGEVLRVIEGLRSTDSTMIIVTHEMEFARRVATKVIYMADGVIEEQGDPETLFTNPQSDKLKSFLKSSFERF